MSFFEAPALLNIPGGQTEPVFLEPWHAEVFSLAVALNRKGVFTWSEWVEVFSAALREIPADAGESAAATYYRRWLAALERLVAYRNLASSEEMAARKGGDGGAPIVARRMGSPLPCNEAPKPMRRSTTVYRTPINTPLAIRPHAQSLLR